MFITDQHRTQIRGYLSEMEKQFDVLTALKPHSLADFQAQPILRAAGERALHLVIECLTDIGNIIIDALIMRDPASYEDIFEILTEEGVFEKTFFEHFIPAVRYRKTLAHEYSKVQAEDVWNMVQAHAADFATMRDSIASYVKL